MKKYIKNRVKNFLTEQMIDGQNMNSHMQTICNTMTVNSYKDVLSMIIAAIGKPNTKNQNLWLRIQKPLQMLKKSCSGLNKEKHTNAFGNTTPDGDNMTGDSIPDEADTYWSTIQSTLCEQGPEFQ